MSIKLINFNFQDNRPVAQLAEHVTLNHGVEGSIPSGPTKKPKLETGINSGSFGYLFPVP
jgi:hypothetical protein